MTINAPRTVRRPGRCALSTNSPIAPTSSATFTTDATTPATRARSNVARAGWARRSQRVSRRRSLLTSPTRFGTVASTRSGVSTVASTMASERWCANTSRTRRRPSSSSTPATSSMTKTSGAARSDRMSTSRTFSPVLIPRPSASSVVSRSSNRGPTSPRAERCARTSSSGIERPSVRLSRNVPDTNALSTLTYPIPRQRAPPIRYVGRASRRAYRATWSCRRPRDP